ncbi:MAG: Gfo/Idh/MocA family oxidoreductase [Chlorobi bacterium]|nr:Gfo/Idh/MocA family oxidoreductase [Chlorobiota bacterium]
MDVAIVGFGHIGKRHYEAIQKLSKQYDLRLVGVVEPDPTNLTGFGVPHFKSLEELYDAYMPDLTIIATPHFLHSQQTIFCLERGSHVICEKPMALHRQDAEQMLDMALRKHKHLFLVQQLRFQPHLKVLKNQLNPDDVFHIGVNLYWNRNEAYFREKPWRAKAQYSGGPLFTQFSHFIDLLLWLLGSLTVDFASFSRIVNTIIDYEDTGIVTLSRGNTTISIDYTISAQPKNITSSVTILSRKGTIVISGQYCENIESIGGYAVKSQPLDALSLHQQVISNAIEVINGRGEPATNALEGLKVVELIEGIYSHRNL